MKRKSGRKYILESTPAFAFGIMMLILPQMATRKKFFPFPEAIEIIVFSKIMLYFE